MARISVVLVLHASLAYSNAWISTPAPLQLRVRESLFSKSQKKLDSNCEDKKVQEASPLLSAVWIGTEMMGNIARAFAKEETSLSSIEVLQGPKSWKEASQRLKMDYKRNYFVTGECDTNLYDENCLFADPFTSFKGRDRFISNLQNLGLFVSGWNIRMLSFEDSQEGAYIKTRLLVKLRLKLPWNPVLAWPWGVKHCYDRSTLRMVAHYESWEIGALEGILQILKPGSSAVLLSIQNAQSCPVDDEGIL
jgi:hypothetical protein